MQKNTIIDFMCEEMSTKVSCTSVASDRFPLSNLLKSSTENKGFQVESFVKPPSSIIIRLPCSIDLIEVHVDPCMPGNCGKMFHLNIFNGKTPSDLVKDDEIKFRSATMNLKKAEKFSFVAPNNSRKLDSNFTVMKGKTSSVRCIKLTIQRMLKGFVPAINKIVILGSVNSSNSKEVKDNVLKNWSLHQQKLTNSLQTTSEKSSLKETGVSVSNEKDQQQMLESYEPFQDSLTFLPMTTPILLPSGHHVDQSSLEKLISSQQSMGLSPRDPFTGIIFSDRYEPVLDVRLKVEIDSKSLKRSSSSLVEIPNKKLKSEVSLKCAKCSCFLDFSAPTYKLSCGHKICSRCSHYVKDNTQKCFKCGVNYTRFDITRSHGIVQ